MSETIYDISEAKSSPNNLTIAKAFSNKLVLCKTIYPDREVAYDSVKYYSFFNRPIDDLQSLLVYVKYLLLRPQCCILRGVCIDDSKIKQRRLLHDDKSSGEYATIIEQEQNWYALDVDEWGEYTGDLRADARAVLLALGLANTEAFAIPSASRGIKPGIRLRIFLWNTAKVTGLALQKHFQRYNVVDTALFRPAQPIYTARPRFIGLSDPCSKLCVWLAGEKQFTDVPVLYRDLNNRPEDKYTKKQAERFLSKFIEEVFNVAKDRHNWLYNRSIALGKWIEQDLLDEETTIEELYLATSVWRGERKRDLDTIRDGVKKGKQVMDEKNGEVEF